RLPSPSSEYTPSTPYSAPGRRSCTTTASRPLELALPSPPLADFADSDTASSRSATEAKQRPVEPLPKRCLTTTVRSDSLLERCRRHCRATWQGKEVPVV